MTDPVIGAVAGAVANHSISKIRELLDTSDDPEHVWEQAIYELSVRIQTSYEHNTQAGRPDDDRFKRDLDRYARMARELAIRGGNRGFDDDLISVLESLADATIEVTSIHGIGSKSMPSAYEDEGVDELIADITKRIGP